MWSFGHHVIWEIMDGCTTVRSNFLQPVQPHLMNRFWPIHFICLCNVSGLQTQNNSLLLLLIIEKCWVYVYCGIVLLMNVTVTLNRGCSLVSVNCEMMPYRKCRKSQYLDSCNFQVDVINKLHPIAFTQYCWKSNTKDHLQGDCNDRMPVPFGIDSFSSPYLDIRRVVFSLFRYWTTQIR